MKQKGQFTEATQSWVREAVDSANGPADWTRVFVIYYLALEEDVAWSQGKFVETGKDTNNL